MLRRKIQGQAGMTLIEIMVVIAIIGVMGTVSVVGFMKSFASAKVKSAREQIRSLEGALDMYNLDNGAYPTTEQGLKALVEKPATGRVPPDYPSGGYLKRNSLPADPWGNSFAYVSPGNHGNPYEITSLGADGVEGGEGGDADVHSWEIGVTQEK